jgi:hypothetical protein
MTRAPPASEMFFRNCAHLDVLHLLVGLAAERVHDERDRDEEADQDTTSWILPSRG